MALSVILLVLGLICLFLAAIGVTPLNGRVNLGWLGMFFWLLAVLLSGGSLQLR